MSEKGLVTKVSGKSMSVKMFPLTSCGECKACDAHRRSNMTIEIENTCNASLGDYVSVDMKETILAGAVIFYGIPLIAFAVGIFLGWIIAPSLVSESLREPITAIAGISFLLISYLCIRLADPLIKSRTTFPVATAIISNDLEDDSDIEKEY
ncbi:MAG: SoxR reducing system RseC family protein [Mobilitalea sp.]